MERGAGRTLWSQIEETLRGEIAGGVWPPGGALPTEAALSARFGVNRHTVRRALAQLTEDGVIRVEQGRGAFVQEHVLDYALGRRTRLSESLSAPESSLARDIIRTAVEPASAQVGKHLGIERGKPVLLLELLSKTGGRPIGLARHYFSAERFPDFIGHFRRAGTITGALAAQGVPDYTRKLTRITAIAPTADEARLLRQARNRPVLRTESVNIDHEGKPVEYGVTDFAADRVQLVASG
jgi:GntR family phosphonate transport system transcriptional regulator